MATYAELYDLRSNSDIRNKIAVAAVKKAQVFIDGATPSSDELTWASATLREPTSEAERLLNYVLAANSSATVAQIVAATDATIQTNVNAAVDALVTGGIV